MPRVPCPTCKAASKAYITKGSQRYRKCIACEQRFVTNEVVVRTIKSDFTPAGKQPRWYAEAHKLRYEKRVSYGQIVLRLRSRYPHINIDRVKYWLLPGRKAKHNSRSKDRYWGRKDFLPIDNTLLPMV